MERFLPVLYSSPLFCNIVRKDLKGLLQCLSAHTKTYGKDQMILRNGEPVPAIGIVCSGSALITREDFLGNRSILARIFPSDIFGEAFAFAATRQLTVNVISAEDSDVLWIDHQKITSRCPTGCVCHCQLIENMMRVLAQKNVQLNQKIKILSKRSTREKLIAYLSAQALEHRGSQFTIPYNRQELADYLCVERSAMSVELGKMKRDGLIDYNRSDFQLKFH